MSPTVPLQLVYDMAVLRLALDAVHHERRRPFRVDKIDAELRQLADPFFVRRERLAELVRVAALEADVGRQDADALGQQADELFQRPRAVRRLDESYGSSPARIRHGGPPIVLDRKSTR